MRYVAYFLVFFVLAGVVWYFVFKKAPATDGGASTVVDGVDVSEGYAGALQRLGTTLASVKDGASAENVRAGLENASIELERLAKLAADLPIAGAKVVRDQVRAKLSDVTADVERIHGIEQVPADVLPLLDSILGSLEAITR